MRFAIAFCLVLIGTGAGPPAFSAERKPGSHFSEARIESLTGATGKLDPQERVFRVSVPRNDLTVTCGGHPITSAMGLTSWAAFRRAGAQMMVMGDLVLTQGQMNSVLSVALESGLEVTALHDHFAAETPRVMFMHIEGMGSEDRLATAVGKVFTAMLVEPSTPFPQHGDVEVQSETAIDRSKIDAALGHSGQFQDGVYMVTIGRTTRIHGHEVGGAMGVTTWAAFSGYNEQAVVDGDFAVLPSELQPVLKALRSKPMNIVAIHQHMADEQPRIFFIHYWGVGRPESLAQALRSALDETAMR